MRGLLLLHLFEYGDAAKSFIAAEHLDPAFAMAYWGEAMTFNHGVWNQVDPVEGKAALDRFAPTAAARAARIGDPREKAYMAAVEILYDGAGAKADRDHRYAQAMEKLAAAYPGDRNAQLFFALALIGQSEGVRDVPVYLRAANISKAIFRLEPDNPGAAHYWIHGMDDPDHAAGALEAARALSKIAPDAPHALHMCSHIFIALGMWDDVVQANVEAIRVGAARDRAEGFPSYNCGHYPDWLEYGYFQQGRFQDARKTIEECRKTDTGVTAWVADHHGQAPFGAKDPARLHHRFMDALADMENMAVIESQDWSAAAPIKAHPAFDGSNAHPWSDPSQLSPAVRPWFHFTNGLAAAQSNRLPEARSALASLRTDMDAYGSGHDADPESLRALQVSAGELSGLIQIEDGHYDTGAAEIRHASDTYRSMAFAFGPPVTIKPPEELLGEVLLAKGDAAGARAAFEQSLQRAPGRSLSLLGLARAAHFAGDESTARATYQKLLAVWHDAGADTPGLNEARNALVSRK